MLGETERCCHEVRFETCRCVKMRLQPRTACGAQSAPSDPIAGFEKGSREGAMKTTRRKGNTYKACITSGIYVCHTTLLRTSVQLSKPSDTTHSARPMRQYGRSSRLPQPGQLTVSDELVGCHNNNSDSWRLSGSDELSFRQSDADGPTEKA